MKKNFIQKNRQSLGKKQSKIPQHKVQKPITMPDKIKSLENKVERLENGNPLQEQILQQMKKIKEQLRQLKIGLKNSPTSHKKLRSHQNISYQQQNIQNFEKNSNSRHVEPIVNQRLREPIQQFRSKKTDRSEEAPKSFVHRSTKKQLIPANKIQPFLKQYKLQFTDLAPYYLGYNKKTNKPVIVKYSDKPMDYLVEIYNKLWKNIVKARWPCINKVYEIKQTQVNVMIMDRNRCGIQNLPYQLVLKDILKILEFIHQSGYLYRNVSPQHFMINEEQKLVVIDFKNARRYLDHKGNQIQVVDQNYNGGDFGSNNQLRHMPENRKDDLQSLGYLALFLLKGDVPWQGMNREQMIKSRTTSTLQQLYKTLPKWLEYMIVINKMGKNDKPDYNKLLEILE